MQLEASLVSVARRQKRQMRKQIRMGERHSHKSTAAAAASFFWNYNTVEMVLLASAVLVNLSGVMFESGRLQSEYYSQQRDIITVCVLIIIFGTILYFFTVVVSEIWATVRPTGTQKKKKKQSGKGGKQSVLDGSFRAGDDIEMTGITPAASSDEGGVNPMFLRGNGNAAIESSLTDNVQELQAQVVRLTKELAQAKAAGQSRARMNRGAAKFQFAARKVMATNKRRGASSRRLSTSGRPAPPPPPAASSSKESEG